MCETYCWTDQIKFIVFDIDGTLAETDDYYIGKISCIVRKIIPAVSQKSVDKVVRPSVMAGETILHGFYRLLDIIGLDGLFSRLHRRFSVSGEYRYEQIKDVEKSLEMLHREYILGVITSGARASTESFLKKYELNDFFSFVISAEDCKYIKPHPMPLLKIAETAGVSIENCLMVGDTVYDILCAKRAGARSAAVKSGFDYGWFLKYHKADVVLDSVASLPDFLMKNRKENVKTEDKTKDLV